jgi:hypothetical protein
VKRAPWLAGLSRLVCLFACGVSLAACASTTPAAEGPQATLRAYAAAIEEGRVDDAYRLLSAEAKRTMSLEAFRRAVQESPEEAKEVARALARPASEPVVTATIVMPNGDELPMVYEDGRWRVDAAAVDLYGQATPRQALMGFLRAFARKRYDVILRYVPDAERHGLARENSAAGAGEVARTEPSELTEDKLRVSWEGPQKEQMSTIVQGILAALPTATIEESGDSGSMAYGAGGTVSFVREQGLWKLRGF